MAAVEASHHEFFRASLQSLSQSSLTADLSMAEIGEIGDGGVSAMPRNPQSLSASDKSRPLWNDEGVQRPSIAGPSPDQSGQGSGQVQTSAGATIRQQNSRNKFTSDPSPLPDQLIPKARATQLYPPLSEGRRPLLSGGVIFPHLDSRITLLQRERFNGLGIFVNVPLNRYLTKKKIWLPPGSVSIDLRFVGMTEDHAKPTMVVYCPPKILSKVRRFFRKKHIKSMYQPDIITTEEPWFEIDFDREGPWTCALTESESYIPHSVYSSVIFPPKVSGIPVIFDEVADFSRLGTIGGIIEVRTGGKPTLYYGMSAGHLISKLEGVPEIAGADPDAPDGDDSSDSEDECSNDSEMEIELEPELESESKPAARPRTGEGETEKSYSETDTGKYASQLDRFIRANGPWTHLGRAFRSPLTFDENGGTRNLDWGLVSEVGRMVPHLGSIRRPGDRIKRYMHSRAEFALSEQSNQPVHFWSAIDGRCEGDVIFGGSMLKIEPGLNFTRTHRLQPSNGRTEIRNGDSGAWVIDESTGEVYGHIVASNALGEGYVVPIQDTLEQIRIVLDASQVEVIPAYIPDSYVSLTRATWPLTYLANYQTSGDFEPPTMGYPHSYGDYDPFSDEYINEPTIEQTFESLSTRPAPQIDDLSSRVPNLPLKMVMRQYVANGRGIKKAVFKAYLRRYLGESAKYEEQTPAHSRPPQVLYEYTAHRPLSQSELEEMQKYSAPLVTLQPGKEPELSKKSAKLPGKISVASEGSEGPYTPPSRV
ncbi:hypothetical protein TWF281_001376 [Arthrobotrys megalospora]